MDKKMTEYAMDMASEIIVDNDTVYVNVNGNENALKVLEGIDKVRRLYFGKHKGHHAWDLTKDWLQMTNDAFFEKYGFNYVPSQFEQAKAREYLDEFKKVNSRSNAINKTVAKTFDKIDLNTGDALQIIRARLIDKGILVDQVAKPTFRSGC